MNLKEKEEALLSAANVLRDAGRTASYETLVRSSHSLRISDETKAAQIAQKRPFGVSIILPTYKGANRIRRAIDSLLNQTESRSRFQVIIISNGPPDNTKNIVTEYQINNPDIEILFLRSETSGASNARNYGIRNARFAYCTYLDDDDYISPNFVRTLLKHAEPNRLVLAKIIDFDDSTQYSSAISQQVQEATKVEERNVIRRPFQVRGILSMTCAKLAPTSCLLGFDFDTNLPSGEDVVFWSEIIAKLNLSIYVPDDIDDAIYYREIRPGSVSRRTDDFSFSVRERLNVIARVREIEASLPAEADKDILHFLRSRYAGQTSFIINYLSSNRDKYSDFLIECARLDIPIDIVQMVNKGLADTLVISYCFPPINDTSSIVMMKRIIGWNWPVRAISNAMDGKRSRSPDLTKAITPRLASHVELNTPVAFAHPSAVQEFSDQSLKTFQNIPKSQAPSKIYSRAMWPASHFAAALIKINNPQVEWTAEFSDPLVLDVHGQKRKGDLPTAWLESSGIADTIMRLSSDNGGCRSIFTLAELLPYAIADKIIFTNESQREYMLSQPWLGSIRKRAMSNSAIKAHPSLPKAYYSIGNSSISIDQENINIGFFGSFYATRGLKEVLHALKDLGTLSIQSINLHVVSSDASALLKEVEALGISSLVKIHDSLPYFDCLASFASMDYLLVNDAATANIKPLNPYLPSKLSDYLGADQPIWALVEPDSPLSKIKLPEGSITSTLGDELDYCRALRRMVIRDKRKLLQVNPPLAV
ncbi:glycosyltransferase [Limimaricola soesokkakensis]|uniref:glycosyltransferase n=1 Tax=Limimaricola soesokkakensis TaxID=1343159 RepID=UPI0035110E4F